MSKLRFFSGAYLLCALVPKSRFFGQVTGIRPSLSSTGSNVQIKNEAHLHMNMCVYICVYIYLYVRACIYAHEGLLLRMWQHGLINFDFLWTT